MSPLNDDHDVAEGSLSAKAITMHCCLCHSHLAGIKK